MDRPTTAYRFTEVRHPLSRYRTWLIIGRPSARAYEPAAAIFAELGRKEPKRRFTVGIVDEHASKASAALDAVYAAAGAPS